MNISKKKKYKLPPGYSFARTMLNSWDYLKNPIGFISNKMEQFGDSYSVKLGLSRTLIITQDPQLITHVLKENHKNYHKSEFTADRAAYFFGKGLLFSNGDYWLQQRRLIQPGFHREKINGLFEIMIKAIDDYLADFPQGKSIDVYPLMHQLAFNIVIKSLFDIPIPPATMQKLSSLFNDVQDFFFVDVNQPFRRIFYPITRSESINLKKAQEIRSIFREIIEQRAKSTEEHADLLDMLLQATYKDSGKSMTTEQILDEILVLIFAGHETTANTLAWILHLIASHPEVLKKVESISTDVSVTESAQNDYLLALIKEGMRLYPPAWMTERVAIEDDQHGEYSFAGGTIIVPFFYGLHRHPDYWDHPREFSPERFLKDTKMSGHYFPFGAGPRLCIGNNFALAEMAFFIHSFFKKFKVEDSGILPLKKPLITLRPDQVLLNIEKK